MLERDSTPNSPEVEGLGKIERIRGVRESDLRTILLWASDPETARHLEPVPQIPQDWNDENQVREAVQKLQDYYNNVGEDGVAEPHKILPFAGVNANDELLSVATMRWKGDPFVDSHYPSRRRAIASIERLITDPKRRRQGSATKLLSTMLEYGFWGYKGYPGGEGAREIRAWIFQDEEAGDWRPNFYLFNKLGFQPVSGHPNWARFAEEFEFDSGGREAIWYYVTPSLYLAAKERVLQQGKEIAPCNTLDISLFSNRLDYSSQAK